MPEHPGSPFGISEPLADSETCMLAHAWTPGRMRSSRGPTRCARGPTPCARGPMQREAGQTRRPLGQTRHPFSMKSNARAILGSTTRVGYSCMGECYCLLAHRYAHPLAPHVGVRRVGAHEQRGAPLVRQMDTARQRGRTPPPQHEHRPPTRLHVCHHGLQGGLVQPAPRFLRRLEEPVSPTDVV